MSNAAAFDRVADTNVADNGCYLDDSFFPTGADIGECDDDTSFFGQVFAAVERSHPAFRSVQQGGMAVDCGEGVFEVAVIAGPQAPRAIRVNFTQTAMLR